MLDSHADVIVITLVLILAREEVFVIGIVLLTTSYYFSLVALAIRHSAEVLLVGHHLGPWAGSSRLSDGCHMKGRAFGFDNIDRC